MLVVDVLEDVLETTVLGLENSVFGGQLQWQFAVKCLSEADFCKVVDRVISVVHAHHGAWRVVFSDQDSFFGAIFTCFDHLQFTSSFGDSVSRFLLVELTVSADDDGSFPRRHVEGNGGDHDGFPEDSAS